MDNFNRVSRKKHRLLKYNYASNGAYFITICTKNREHLFGVINNNCMTLNELGKIVQKEILLTNEKRKSKNIEIVKWVIMPNHVHLIININNSDSKKYEYSDFSKLKSDSIPVIVRSFKSSVTKSVHEYCKNNNIIEIPYVIWQRDYHDHIIRDEKSYNKIYDYIGNNPRLWEDDCYNE